MNQLRSTLLGRVWRLRARRHCSQVCLCLFLNLQEWVRGPVLMPRPLPYLSKGGGGVRMSQELIAEGSELESFGGVV